MERGSKPCEYPWEKLSSGNSKCKGPAAEACLEFLGYMQCMVCRCYSRMSSASYSLISSLIHISFPESCFLPPCSLRNRPQHRNCVSRTKGNSRWINPILFPENLGGRLYSDRRPSGSGLDQPCLVPLHREMVGEKRRRRRRKRWQQQWRMRHEGTRKTVDPEENVSIPRCTSRSGILHSVLRAAPVSFHLDQRMGCCFQCDPAAQKARRWGGSH